jgi:hypothetical protein
MGFNSGFKGLTYRSRKAIHVLSLAVCFKYICRSEGITLHIFLMWTPHVGMAQPHVAAALTYEKSSLCPKYRRLCGPQPGLDVLRCNISVPAENAIVIPRQLKRRTNSIFLRLEFA